MCRISEHPSGEKLRGPRGAAGELSPKPLRDFGKVLIGAKILYDEKVITRGTGALSALEVAFVHETGVYVTSRGVRKAAPCRMLIATEGAD